MGSGSIDMNKIEESIFNRKKPVLKKNAFRRKKSKQKISIGKIDPKTFLLKKTKMMKSMYLKTLPGSSVYFNKRAVNLGDDNEEPKRLKSQKSEIEKSLFSINKNSLFSPRSEKSRLGETSRLSNYSKMLSPRVINSERSTSVNFKILIFRLFRF